MAWHGATALVLDACWWLFYAVLCIHALDFGVNWDEGLQTDLGLCTWRQLTSAAVKLGVPEKEVEALAKACLVGGSGISKL